eukprot:GHVU01199645.1.p1 GENE.GHVU01199645.1~~GHVU01199645.1.p1  ORF type:complete len:167 (+),score=21.62 GHVU01199645.1:79-579(+)
MMMMITSASLYIAAAATAAATGCLGCAASFHPPTNHRQTDIHRETDRQPQTDSHRQTATDTHRPTSEEKGVPEILLDNVHFSQQPPLCVRLPRPSIALMVISSGTSCCSIGARCVVVARRRRYRTHSRLVRVGTPVTMFEGETDRQTDIDGQWTDRLTDGAVASVG